MMLRTLGMSAWMLACTAGHCAYAGQEQTSIPIPHVATDVQKPTLAAHEWVLHRIVDSAGNEEGDVPVSAMTGDPLVRLRFDEQGHISVRVCNFLTFQYSLVGTGGIRAFQVFQTMAACSADEDMRMEERVKGKLVLLRRYQISAALGDECRLTLYFGDRSRWELKCSPATP